MLFGTGTDSLTLTIEARNQCDDRTIGELFYRYCQELEDIRFSEALLLLLARLI